MNTNTMELNLNEMEVVNGGFDWVKTVVWGAVGATVGAGIGASVGGIPGMVVGGVVGGAIGVVGSN